LADDLITHAAKASLPSLVANRSGPRKPDSQERNLRPACQIND
jgi:hypothetical protein